MKIMHSVYLEKGYTKFEIIFYTCICAFLAYHFMLYALTLVVYHADKSTYILMHVSLGSLVPNSRDRHEKQWRPDFTCHKIHPKIHFV